MEIKRLPLLDAAMTDTDTGGLIGLASSFNGLDEYGDTVIPGAYTKTIPKFVQDGSILWSHNDDRFPVGYAARAEERDEGLWLETVFHSDVDAQRLRRIVAERLTAGKRVGLSIGYWPKQSETTPEGVRRLLEIELLEVSIVPVPADDAARVQAVKARLGAALADGTHGLSYDAHAAQVERVLAEFLARSTAGVEQRKAEGRALSADRIAAMARMSGSLHDAHAALAALTQAAQPKSYAVEWALLQTRLRLAGVEVGSP